MGGKSKLSSSTDMAKWLKPYFLQEGGVLPALKNLYMPNNQPVQYNPAMNLNYIPHTADELQNYIAYGPEQQQRQIGWGQENLQNFIAPTQDIYQRAIGTNSNLYRQFVDPTGKEFLRNIDPTGKEYQRIVKPTGNEYLKYINPTGEENQRFVNPADEIYNRFVNPSNDVYGQFQDLTDYQRQGIKGLADSAGMQQQLASAAANQALKTASGEYLSAESNPYLKGNYEAAAKAVEDSYRYGTAPELQAQAMRAGAFGGPAYSQKAWQERWGLGANLNELASRMYGENYQQERNRQEAASQNMGNTMALQTAPASTLYRAGELERDPLLEAEKIRQQNAMAKLGFGQQQEEIRAGNAATRYGLQQKEEDIRRANAMQNRDFSKEQAQINQENALLARGYNLQSAEQEQKNALLARQYAEQAAANDQRNALMGRDFANERDEMKQANALAERGYLNEAEAIRQRNAAQQRDFQLEQEMIRLQNKERERGFLTEDEKVRLQNARDQRAEAQQAEAIRQNNTIGQRGWSVEEEMLRQQNAKQETMWPYEMINQYLAALTGSGQGYSRGSQSNPNANSWVNSLIGAGGTMGGAGIMALACSLNYKDDIEDMTETEARKLLDLRPVTFNWKETGNQSAGVIAEEAQQLDPRLVIELNGRVLGVNAAGVIAMLLKIVQTQERRIKALEAKRG